MIYFDNAATSYPKPKEVVEALSYAVINFTSPNRGFYKSSSDTSKMIFNTRKTIANFFGLEDPLSVAFTSNVTESLNLVINSLLNEDDHVITTNIEHNAVIRPLVKNNISYSIYNIQTNLNNLNTLLKPNTKAIICSHSSNVLGNILNIKYIGEFCKKNNLLFILDASATAGNININMVENNIDVLCFTGHKSLYSVPIGGICIKDHSNLTFKNTKVGGTGNNSLSLKHETIMPYVFEAGTPNYISIYALYTSINYINNIGISVIQNHCNNLVQKLYNGIKDIEGIKIYGDFNKSRTPILSFNYKDYDSNDIAMELNDSFNIAVRSGFHCAPLVHENINTTKTGLVRISFSYNNTVLEVDKAILAIKSILV